MAVVAVRSDILTNTRANLRQNPSYIDGGIQRTTSMIISLSNGDSIGSVYRLMQIPSWARIRSIMMYTGPNTGCAINIGLYRTEADGGAVVLANAYVDQRSIAANTYTGVQLAVQQRTQDKFNQQVWQDAGYTTDPRLFLDLAVTLTAAAGGTNTTAFDIGWVMD